jgi:3-hydroxyacyl-CoA dehydrogenase
VGARIAGVMTSPDKAGQFAERVTLDVLAYASRRIPEIADDVVNVDRGMRWGFGWDLGPFEVWDAYGVRKGVERMKALGLTPAPWVTQMLASGQERFYGTQGVRDTAWDLPSKSMKPVSQSARVARVEYLRRGNKQLKANDSASLWDMGDGALLLEFHSKMNSIDDDITTMMNTAVDEAEKGFRALVVANDGGNFSAGANIMGLLMAIRSDDFEGVRKSIQTFQAANQRLRYSAIPVVTAPFNLALGGGAEVAMAGNAIQASAELYLGLVEVGVGLIPGGGGNLELLRNVYGPYAPDKDFDPLPFLKKVFLTIAMAKVSTSAEEARELGYLAATDGISLNREFLLSDAKARALGMASSGFRPPRRTHFLLPGRNGYATIDMLLYDMELTHQISEHDRKIAQQLARVLTGGEASPTVPVSEARLLELEAEAFLSLCGEPKTQDRIQFMLEKGKPLRN